MPFTSYKKKKRKNPQSYRNNKDAVDIYINTFISLYKLVENNIVQLTYILLYVCDLPKTDLYHNP